MRRLIGICVLLACGPAQAAATYQYIGSNYDDTIINSEPPFGTYTTAMRMSASFTVPAPLDLASDGDISGLVTAYSVNDGRFTLTESNSSIFRFDVTVDAVGAIGTWDILVDDIVGASLGDTVSSLLTASGIDSAFAGICPEAICDRDSPFGLDIDVASANSGSWSIVPAPLPGAVWLLGSALGMLGRVRRGRVA